MPTSPTRPFDLRYDSGETSPSSSPNAASVQSRLEQRLRSGGWAGQSTYLRPPTALPVGRRSRQPVAATHLQPRQRRIRAVQRFPSRSKPIPQSHKRQGYLTGMTSQRPISEADPKLTWRTERRSRSTASASPEPPTIVASGSPQTVTRPSFLNHQIGTGIRHPHGRATVPAAITCSTTSQTRLHRCHLDRIPQRTHRHDHLYFCRHGRVGLRSPRGSWIGSASSPLISTPASGVYPQPQACSHPATVSGWRPGIHPQQQRRCLADSRATPMLRIGAAVNELGGETTFRYRCPSRIAPAITTPSSRTRVVE